MFRGLGEGLGRLEARVQGFGVEGSEEGFKGFRGSGV